MVVDVNQTWEKLELLDRQKRSARQSCARARQTHEIAQTRTLDIDNQGVPLDHVFSLKSGRILRRDRGGGW